MKKLIAIMAMPVIAIALAACRSQENPGAEPTVPDEFTQSSTQETPHIWDSVEVRPPGSPSN